MYTTLSQKAGGDLKITFPYATVFFKKKSIGYKESFTRLDDNLKSIWDSLCLSQRTCEDSRLFIRSYFVIPVHSLNINSWGKNKAVCRENENRANCTWTLPKK